MPTGRILGAVVAGLASATTVLGLGVGTATGATVDAPHSHAARIGHAGQRAAGIGDASPATGGPWGQQQFVDPTAWLNSISCVSAAFCAAVDGNGNAFVRKGIGARWTYYANIDPYQNANLVSVSCPTETFCAALDGLGNAMTYNGRRWSSPVDLDLPGGARVSCPTTTFCVAANYHGLGSYFDGANWSAPVTIDSAASDGSLFDMSCGSPTLCAAVDYHGNATMFDGQSWSDPISVDPGHFGPDFVSCVGTQFCMAADEFGYVLTYSEGVWSAPMNLTGSDQLQLLSCASETFCMVMTFAAHYYLYDGSSWSSALQAPLSPQALHCASRTFCSATDGGGVTDYRLPTLSGGG